MAGATSCLTTNAFTMKWAKPCAPIFLVTMADFFWPTGQGRIPSPNIPPGTQVSMARAECLIIGGWRDAICGWSLRRSRVQGVRVSRAKPKTSRFDLWRIPDPRSYTRSSEYQGRSRRRRCDMMCACVGVHSMTWCSGKPRVEDPNWEKLCTKGEAKERIIMWSTRVSWAKLKPTSRRLRVSKA